MYIIGLTGGIACGKSTVAKILRSRGFEIFSLDELTHRLLNNGEILSQIYIEHFGEKILAENGSVNRKLVGEIIFNSRVEKQWINSVSHPIFLNQTREFLIDCLERNILYVAVETPLLFECGWEDLFDEIWTVCASQSNQIKRLIQRNKLTKEQALARINSQISMEEICARASIKIENNGSYHEIYEQTLKALKNLVN